MLAGEVLNPRGLIPCRRLCAKANKKNRAEHRFSGILEYIVYEREIERALEKLIENSILKMLKIL
jgi:hypothetical protein